MEPIPAEAAISMISPSPIIDPIMMRGIFTAFFNFFS